MARAYTPGFGQNYTGNARRVVSVGELERVYGRNAQVELRAPLDQLNQQQVEPQGYYDPEAYDDPVELPVRRSPWLPIVVLLMLGVGAFIGFAMYRRGIVPAQLVQQRVVLQESESLPSAISWQPPPVLPILSSNGIPTPTGPSANRSAGDESSTDSSASDATANAAAGEQANSAASAAAEDKSNSGASGRGAARNRANEDEAATLKAIRREREQLQTQPARPRENAQRNSAESVYPEPTPPGYIEAETPAPP
jgi:hypothetical protein